MLPISPDIDLFDETLREGAERSPLFVDIATKVDLACEITECGVRTFVVGMYPDVPHNIELTEALLNARTDGRLPAATRFVIISHLGYRLRSTIEHIQKMTADTSSLWVLGIHSVSDEQIRYLFPTVQQAGDNPNLEQWLSLPDSVRRQESLVWLQKELDTLGSIPGIGGTIAGLLDAFRADPGHLSRAVQVVADSASTRSIRLVDTAGTCVPGQARELARALTTAHPDINFYGHFHDDFGMATANAVTGLSAGLAGVDVSVGGLANRAGHPALAEVIMAVRHLSSATTAPYTPGNLFRLSRLVEEIYGLIERPCQPITGAVTYSVQSGIRTDLLDRSPKIFDEVNPADIGSEELRMFGVRSGSEGLLRILQSHRSEVEQVGIEISEEFAEAVYQQLIHEWGARSERSAQRLRAAITEHASALRDAFFDEKAVVEWIVRSQTTDAKKGTQPA